MSKLCDAMTGECQSQSEIFGKSQKTSQQARAQDFHTQACKVKGITWC